MKYIELPNSMKLKYFKIKFSVAYTSLQNFLIYFLHSTYVWDYIRFCCPHPSFLFDQTGEKRQTLFNKSSLLTWAWGYETPEGPGSTEGAKEALTRHSDQTTARKCSLVGDTFETHIYSGAYTA